jgi:hypothetical protein
MEELVVFPTAAAFFCCCSYIYHFCTLYSVAAVFAVVPVAAPATLLHVLTHFGAVFGALVSEADLFVVSLLRSLRATGYDVASGPSSTICINAVLVDRCTAEYLFHLLDGFLC